jgi:hypothetical protein
MYTPGKAHDKDIIMRFRAPNDGNRYDLVAGSHRLSSQPCANNARGQLDKRGGCCRDKIYGISVDSQTKIQ